MIEKHLIGTAVARESCKPADSIENQ